MACATLVSRTAAGKLTLRMVSCVFDPGSRRGAKNFDECHVSFLLFEMSSSVTRDPCISIGMAEKQSRKSLPE